VISYQWSKHEPTFITAELQNNAVDDNTHRMQYMGRTTFREYLHLALKHQFSSSWTSYPEKYKFFGLQINISDV
jgi:hypothetical protein